MENQNGCDYPPILTSIVLERAGEEINTNQFIWHYDLTISSIVDRIINSTELALETKVLLAKRWGGWKWENNREPFTVVYEALRQIGAIDHSKRLFGEEKVRLTDSGQDLLDLIKEGAVTDAYKRDRAYLETMSPEKLFEDYEKDAKEEG
ncbi:MAG TPA: hypothetical protein HA282_02720 [Nanoarchaeota archaeon]|nr:hypothetical protein [Candidatus Pacearchaeota archaeon]HIH17230.1 hypothetical protein [Nanoarchaeota archaeon]HIH50999.1 hypothetical protein [Nanoarchaeota archaeon]HIH66106.1 hypothetical protein [Nanoarchaeota archaeon]